MCVCVCVRVRISHSYTQGESLAKTLSAEMDADKAFVAKGSKGKPLSVCMCVGLFVCVCVAVIASVWTSNIANMCMFLHVCAVLTHACMSVASCAVLD